MTKGALRRSVPAERRRPDALATAFALAGALLVAFILLPLISLVAGVTPAQLWETLRDAQVLDSLLLTFASAGWATLAALLLGVPLAYLLARYDFPGKAWLEGLIDLPIVIPHTAAGIALLLIFGRQGLVGRLFLGAGITFSDALPGIVVGMLFVSLPFLVNGAQEAFALVDPELELMAETMGATHWQAFWHITLPLAWRGVLGGALMMWGRGISEFGAVMILAYNPKIIPVLVYERFAGFGLQSALPVAVILIIASLLVFFALRAVMPPRWRDP